MTTSTNSPSIVTDEAAAAPLQNVGMNRLTSITCDHCHRQLELREIAGRPDPGGDEERLLCKWCWATIVFRRARKPGPLTEPELSEGSPEEVTS